MPTVSNLQAATQEILFQLYIKPLLQFGYYNKFLFTDKFLFENTYERMLVNKEF